MTKSTVMTATAVSFIVASLFLTASVKAMSDHVPSSACASMIPLGHEADAQVSSPPYVLKVPAGPIPIDSEANVVISGMDPTIMFKGFFIKAFDDVTGVPTGKFTQAPKTINCENPSDGAHHADATLKESVVLAWMPPLGFSGSVTFMATIVQNRTTFWTGVVSEPLVFSQ